MISLTMFLGFDSILNNLELYNDISENIFQLNKLEIIIIVELVIVTFVNIVLINQTFLFLVT